MRTLKQLAREFWMQILLATAWSTYRVWPLSFNSIGDFITNFAGAFFLTSWGFGQIIRIKRQQKVEDEFQTVKEEIKHLLQELEKQTQHLIGHTTGGESYGYFEPMWWHGTMAASFSFTNHSNFPVFDVFAEWIDLDEPINPPDTLWTRHHINLGNVYPNKIAMNLFTIDMTNRDALRINIFLQTRNSGGIQQIRVRKIDGILKFAVKTEVSNFKKTEIPNDYPGYDPENPDDVFK